MGFFATMVVFYYYQQQFLAKISLCRKNTISPLDVEGVQLAFQFTSYPWNCFLCKANDLGLFFFPSLTNHELQLNLLVWIRYKPTMSKRRLQL